MSATNQNSLYEILGMLMEKHGESPPFANAKEMYSHIDAANIGGVPWQCLSVTIPGNHGPETPIWKRKAYDIWYRDPNVILTNLLSNPDFNGEFTYRPYDELEQTVDGEEERHWSQFMSANFAWRQSASNFTGFDCQSVILISATILQTKIYNENPQQNKDAMYCVVITGSDKTTVSVTTGQVEYYPGYLSIGNVHNNVQRGHRNAVVPYVFFAIPKGASLSSGLPLY